MTGAITTFPASDFVGLHTGFVAPAVRFFDAQGRHAVLQAELRERQRDGWQVMHSSNMNASLRHTVSPPWWGKAIVMAAGVLSVPASVMLGPTLVLERWPPTERFLDVRVLGMGIVKRASSGHIPKGWRRDWDWEVADGRFSYAITSAG